MSFGPGPDGDDKVAIWVDDGSFCSVFRDLLHPGGVFPPVQYDGLARPEPDRRLHVGQYRLL